MVNDNNAGVLARTAERQAGVHDNSAGVKERGAGGQAGGGGAGGQAGGGGWGRGPGAERSPSVSVTEVLGFESWVV